MRRLSKRELVANYAIFTSFSALALGFTAWNHITPMLVVHATLLAWGILGLAVSCLDLGEDETPRH